MNVLKNILWGTTILLTLWIVSEILSLGLMFTNLPVLIGVGTLKISVILALACFVYYTVKDNFPSKS